MDEYLAFLVLADELLISPNPADAIVRRMRRLMLAFQQEIQYLDGDRIRTAWALPSTHPVRKLFIESVATPYLVSRFTKLKTVEKDFYLYQELNTVPSSLQIFCTSLSD